MPLPTAVKVAINGRHVTVESGNNKLCYLHRPEVTVKVDDNSRQIVIESIGESRTAKAMHGLTRALINNMVVGVSKGFTKELVINGVGWTAKVQGMKIALNVGYADTREVEIPADVQVVVQGNTIRISGPDKQQVGQLAATIRAVQPPEPYNGKGIKYADEQIIRKQGKALGSGVA